jgi:hypothetical protein
MNALRFDMQDLLAILIVFLAAAFLVRRAWQHFTQRHPGRCGSCSNCPSAGSSQVLLKTISPIVSHAKAQRRKESAN